MTSPHRRLNALTGDWVLVSPQRATRPWQGIVEATPAQRPPAHDPGCYLCPGNERAGGHRTPPYESTFVFDNDFPALLPSPPTVASGGGLLTAAPVRGICRVVCYSPRHDLTLGELSVEAVAEVVDVWTAQYLDLGERPWIEHVQIFENRGAMTGASNPHPHGQIWAEDDLPDLVRREDARMAAYSGCLLCDYLATELAADERIVLSDDRFVALVPWWATWPFETLVLPRAHAGALPDLDAAGRVALAGLLRRLARTYDNVFGVTFPYSMGLHQRPTGRAAKPEWHLHAHFFPPLLRSATVRKYMGGYEFLGRPQRDLTPESAAARLREAAAGA
ncbi:galactose-1-phosphate uridylyltransferase [Actinoplanes cyaneus]|uniref:Galactose-1-phosphate uridylyltransferase n=1 Tax=Actinoplanes cyaneus TaxID=52696 RepID=A0A919ISK0_9ACTN|nr:UDP-glucose--hexose-1-phosphate uridylyltransferase [Actinoplanes cyaneus]MCW2138162.1 UTP-hexose-1-phosphate uridylyltransferase /UDP-glucose-hexose-1-phosphate uridylyltransferase [Actinoplanes cyaneus]GID70542.1 galactose-1-phosphate uridylyltransferase [Actinoplanes cyaneus]